MTRPIPEGFHTITAYLLVPDVPAQLDFLRRAFDAVELERVTLPDGSVMHAQVRIGDSMLMMGRAPAERPPMPMMLYLYVADADAAYHRAIAAGAESVQEPHDEFYGDRNGGVKDAAGNMWWVATHLRDVPPDEMQRLAAHARGQGSGA